MTWRGTDVTAAEEQMLTAFMQQLHAAPLDVSPRVPGAEILVVKARLLRQWNAQRRAERPMDLMEPVEIAAGLVAAVLLLVWSVPSAFAWIPRLLF